MPVGVPANSGSPWVTTTVLSAVIASHASIVFRFGRKSSGPRCANGVLPVAACAAPRGALKADDHRAAALEERLARELLVEHLGHGYFPPFAITAAAFWIAVRIRGYVPQRQRWPFIAVRICASVGRFVVASRSAAWIIIPFWQ